MVLNSCFSTTQSISQIVSLDSHVIFDSSWHSFSSMGAGCISPDSLPSKLICSLKYPYYNVIFSTITLEILSNQAGTLHTLISDLSIVLFPSQLNGRMLNECGIQNPKKCHFHAVQWMKKKDMLQSNLTLRTVKIRTSSLLQEPNWQ